MQEMSKMTILVIFCYFQGLGTCLESKQETLNFDKMLLCFEYNFHEEKFENYISSSVLKIY